MRLKRRLACWWVLWGLLLGCGADPASEPNQPASGADPELEEPSEPTGPCPEMERDDCLRSTRCILEVAEPDGYACRDARPPCEGGIHQSDREGCEARDGCAWVASECYCPEGMVCFCGGGPPAQCVPAGGDTDDAAEDTDDAAEDTDEAE